MRADQRQLTSAAMASLVNPRGHLKNCRQKLIGPISGAFARCGLPSHSLSHPMGEGQGEGTYQELERCHIGLGFSASIRNAAPPIR